MRKKTFHKIIRFQGEGRKNKRKYTFMEFGWVENPTFKNDIYFMINSAHKGGSGTWELRTDEALCFIQGLAAAINRKMTGLVLERKQ